MVRAKADRPAKTETEITPEMIEAGKNELFGFNPDLDSYGEVVAKVFRAMVEARDSAREERLSPRPPSRS